jgi:ketosteroid isomerase-like protein
MAQENVEVVRQIYDAWNRNETSRLADLFDEHVQLRLNAVMGPYVGREGVRQFVADLLADWSQLSLTIEEAVVQGDQIVVIVREEGIGRSSHVPITSIENHVWTVRGGKACHAAAYPSRAKALEAAGLRE